MPELPDIEAYVEALHPRVVGQPLRRLRVASPFVLRSVDPPASAAEGKVVRGVRRLGKRVVLELEEGVFVVLHLMIAGRLQWKKPGTKGGLATFEFPDGTLVFTEAGSKHRASLHVARDLAAFGAGALEPLDATRAELAAALRAENHTLKRALTDPRSISGIGNAYSDEILHRARLSPVLLTQRMDDEQMDRLHEATQAVLADFSGKLKAEARAKWPTKVTAFRPEFAVHGKFGRPCPVCGTLVQRIVRGAGRVERAASAPSRAPARSGEHETNYCPRCQTGGKMLADRALSKLLHEDWPQTIEEWEGRAMPGRATSGPRTRP